MHNQPRPFRQFDLTSTINGMLTISIIVPESKYGEVEALTTFQIRSQKETKLGRLGCAYEIEASHWDEFLEFMGTRRQREKGINCLHDEQAWLAISWLTDSRT
jgi:hypothetical protein